MCPRENLNVRECVAEKMCLNEIVFERENAVCVHELSYVCVVHRCAWFIGVRGS